MFQGVVWELDVLGQSFLRRVFGVHAGCLWAMDWFWGLFRGLMGHGTKAAPQSDCPLLCLGSGGEGGLAVQHAAGVGMPSG